MRPWVPGLVLLAAALALSCFDPLYEDLGQIRTWVVCCRQGQVDTCPCTVPAGCTPNLRACTGGTCAMPATATCSGMPDGGPPSDGGSAQDGGHRPSEYELCCVTGAVTTCACPASGCRGQTFVACGGGTCVAQEPCP